MEIKFDWKVFEVEKPEVGKRVIFKRNDELILAIYNGDISNTYERKGCWNDDRKFPIYSFFGSRINTKTYKKDTQIIYPIYTPWSYSKEAFKESGLEEPKNEYNPYNFEWDYYCDNWL